ncbi:VOC family protein [Acuticoccus kandeliae]|uniref:VOC family protein n=1 Tax=Acuticoccus kandeliae TaxID=2073160 RepID=UPI000D3E72CF|nr:VOC family protein [Acuticoccus kandeliae]
MLDHIEIHVRDIEKARAFYDSALAPLGLRIVMSVTPQESGGTTRYGYGRRAHPDFWISDLAPASTGVHIAFTAPDHATVSAFYAAAMEAGGRDNGPPGPRLHYHPAYYAAFVLDPDGNNIEAVHFPAAG